MTELDIAGIMNATDAKRQKVGLDQINEAERKEVTL
jgi:hypothetical protein